MNRYAMADICMRYGQYNGNDLTNLPHISVLADSFIRYGQSTLYVAEAFPLKVLANTHCGQRVGRYIVFVVADMDLRYGH